jgi:threonine dehydrogenase-like Zn-dependent dehydrogenase
MKTTALRIHGKNDLRLDTFELPDMQDDEILCEVVSNSVCMSSHKAALQGADHKRVPKDVAEHPTIIGHEFAGRILDVGSQWKDRFKPGEKFSIQPAIEDAACPEAAPGYSFRHIGGMASRIIVPAVVLKHDCFLPYGGEDFFKASLSEPMSCVVGAVHAQYHTVHTSYEHTMGIVPGGKCAILAGAGPMGLGCIDYLVHGPCQPGVLVVTDIDEARLRRAESVISKEEAAKHGVELLYVNTSGVKDCCAFLKELVGGRGYDDVFVFAPVAPLIELGDSILARNGCLNFFAGPTKSDFTAHLNFYNIHYSGTHVVGTSGGNTDDMRESLQLMSEGRLNPASMITHIGGITCAADTIMRLPEIPGGKKLIYTQRDLPLVALDELSVKGEADPFYGQLDRICRKHGGVWNAEAEDYLLANSPHAQRS